MNKGKEYELFAQRIFQKLKSFETQISINVQHDIKLRGKSGCDHQIDVFFEYKKEGKKYRYAVECKNLERAVSIGKVREFYGALSDIGEISGIIVSRKGFQSGARQYAKSYGISLKTLREPEIDETVGEISCSFKMFKTHFLFKVNENWARETGFNIKSYRDKCASLSLYESSKWENSEHQPYVLIERTIYDSNKRVIATLDELDKNITRTSDAYYCKVFKYGDAWISTKQFGLLRIDEVKYECTYSVYENVINILATGFVEGILEDALEGQKEYISKF